MCVKLVESSSAKLIGKYFVCGIEKEPKNNIFRQL